MVIAALGLIVALLALGVAVLGYRHTRGHDAAILTLQQERAARESQALWDLHAVEPRNWSMDSPAGPIRELLAEATNRGGVDSGAVTVRAQIDGIDVGRSAPCTVSAHGVAQVGVPNRHTRWRGRSRCACSMPAAWSLRRPRCGCHRSPSSAARVHGACMNLCPATAFGCYVS